MHVIDYRQEIYSSIKPAAHSYVYKEAQLSLTNLRVLPQASRGLYVKNGESSTLCLKKSTNFETLSKLCGSILMTWHMRTLF